MGKAFLLALICAALCGCVTIESYRVVGGVGKVMQDTETETETGTPGHGTLTADNRAAATVGSNGVVSVVTGENDGAADKTVRDLAVDAKPGVNAKARDVTLPVGPGL